MHDDHTAAKDERAANALRADTETDSLRIERGAREESRDPRERMRDVPLAPHSAGVLGVGAAPADDEGVLSETVEADLRAARRDNR